MIDKAIFAEAMSVLADRFNRPLHPATQRRYFEILSRELSTEEFTAAAELAFRDSSFWPSPREIIEYIKPLPDLSLEASVAFEKTLALSEPSPQGPFWRKDRIHEELGEAAVAAFAAIGAQGRLRSLTTDDLPFARREFITAYRAAALQMSKRAAATNALQIIGSALALTAGSGNGSQR